MYFNGALSLQPEGLRPITSLSTLDRHGCPYRPKTRYQVRWVTASWAALTAASKHSASWRTTCQYHANSGGWFWTTTSCSPLPRFWGATKGKRFPVVWRSVVEPVCGARSFCTIVFTRHLFRALLLVGIGRCRNVRRIRPFRTDERALDDARFGVRRHEGGRMDRVVGVHTAPPGLVCTKVLHGLMVLDARCSLTTREDRPSLSLQMETPVKRSYPSRQ